MRIVTNLQFLGFQVKLDMWDKKEHTRLRLIRGIAEGNREYVCFLDSCEKEDLRGFIFENAGRGRPGEKELSDLVLYGDYFLPKEIMILRQRPTSTYYSLFIKPYSPRL